MTCVRCYWVSGVGLVGWDFLMGVEIAILSITDFFVDVLLKFLFLIKLFSKKVN